MVPLRSVTVMQTRMLPTYVPMMLRSTFSKIYSVWLYLRLKSTIPCSLGCLRVPTTTLNCKKGKPETNTLQN